MLRRVIVSIVGASGLGLAGCSTADRLPIESPQHITYQPRLGNWEVPASGAEVGSREIDPSGIQQVSATTIVPSGPLSLQDVTALTLERNPRLAQVGWAIESARGRAVQAGLYPNPTVAITGNEISDRTGPSGIWSVYASQEWVRGNKLGLSRAAAEKEIDQATLAVVAERYRVLTDVRIAYYEAITLQRRVAILEELVKLAEDSVGNAEKLLKAKETARLDVVQLEVDLERYRAEREAAKQALPAAYQKLAATVGVDQLPAIGSMSDLDIPLPEYELERVRTYVLGIHPTIRSAQLGVERARLLVRRAEVEPIPNLTVGAGYTNQGQNRSNDWDAGVSLPIPVWNKNQGNVLAAKAQLGEAVNEISRVQLDLVNRLSTSFGKYTAARQRVERYRSAIVPKAEETYQLSLKAYQGGQFEYLRVLAAQRTVAEARLELIRSLGETWDAACEIAGLMLEDQWPFTTSPPNLPSPQP